jgi:hypothetical protein
MRANRQKKQVIQNFETLINNFNLCPEVKKFVATGEIPVAVTIPYLHISCNVLLSEHEDIQRIVRDFEEKYDACVYLCVSSSNSLSMLYLGKDESDWDYLAPHMNDNYVWAAVYNWGYQTYEFGDILLGSYRGVLTRIG